MKTQLSEGDIFRLARRLLAAACGDSVALALMTAKCLELNREIAATFASTARCVGKHGFHSAATMIRNDIRTVKRLLKQNGMEAE